MDLHIISECYVDTKLIKTIAPPTYLKSFPYNADMEEIKKRTEYFLL